MSYYRILMIILITGTGISVSSQSIIDLTGFAWQISPEEDVNWDQEQVLSLDAGLSEYTINEPTKGWNAFLTETAVEVQPPITVEEYLKRYGEENTRGAWDFSGVAWLYTFFDIPGSWRKDQISLQFEGVEMKAEIYLNEQLVGVQVLNGVPFEVDISEAAAPGSLNLLALRLTDPIGGENIPAQLPVKWLSYSRHSNKGYCGIPGQVNLVRRDDVYISDVFIRNRKDYTSIQVAAEIQNLRSKLVSGTLTFDLLEPITGKIIASKKRNVDRVYGSWVITMAFSERDFINSNGKIQQVWEEDAPRTYWMRVSWEGKDRSTSVMETSFGFRWFETGALLDTGFFTWNDSSNLVSNSVLDVQQGFGYDAFRGSMDQQARCWIQQIPGRSIEDNEADIAIKQEKALRTIYHIRSCPSLVMYEAHHEIRPTDLEGVKEFLLKLHEADPTRLKVLTYKIAVDIEEDPLVIPEGMLYMKPYDDVISEKEIIM